MITICKTFEFDAAHHLTKVPDGHKCKNMHGHTYSVDIEVQGDMNPDLGWLIGYEEIAAAWAPIEKQLDHRCLNDVDGLENPTTENLVAWILARIGPPVRALGSAYVSRVRVHESSSTWAEVRP